jgi:nucleoid-associated protein YgaU
MLKKYLSCLLLILAVIFAGSCKSTQQSSPEPAPSAPPAAEPASQPSPPPESKPASQPVQPAQAPEPQPEKEIPPPKATGNIILEGAQTHRVVWGDTLSKLALRYYGKGNGYYYPLIILGNPGATVNPDLIIPGSGLKIPNLQRNLDNAAARAELKTYIEDLIVFYDRKPDKVMSANLRSLADKL